MTAAEPHEKRWRRRPEERPRQIIDAALEVFGEHGLAAARLEDIAHRAGVSKGTIYLYFPNKETLFREMIRQRVAEMIIRAEQSVVATGGTASTRLRAYARLLWSHVRAPMFQRLYRLVNGELRQFPGLFEFFMREVPARNMAVIAGIVRHGIDTGEFRRIDDSVAARMFQVLVLNHGVWCAERERIPFLAHLSDDAVLEQLLDFYLHAILATGTAPSAHSVGAHE